MGDVGFAMRLVAPIGVALVAGALPVSSAHAACSAPVLRGANLVVSCPAAASEQSFVVPADVTRLRVIAVGGSGGGRGVAAVASGDLRVTPGSTLYVLVGGAGGFGQRSGLPGAGGFKGGGRGAWRPISGSARDSPQPVVVAGAARRMCGPAACATARATRWPRD